MAHTELVAGGWFADTLLVSGFSNANGTISASPAPWKSVEEVCYVQGNADNGANGETELYFHDDLSTDWITVSFHVRFANISDDSDYDFFRISIYGTTALRCRITSSGGNVTFTDTSGDVGTITSAVDVDTWYRCTIKYKAVASSSFRVWWSKAESQHSSTPNIDTTASVNSSKTEDVYFRTWNNVSQSYGHSIYFGTWLIRSDTGAAISTNDTVPRQFWGRRYQSDATGTSSDWGSNLDSGSWPNAEELPKNDSNVATFTGTGGEEGGVSCDDPTDGGPAYDSNIITGGTLLWGIYAWRYWAAVTYKGNDSPDWYGIYGSAASAGDPGNNTAEQEGTSTNVNFVVRTKSGDTGFPSLSDYLQIGFGTGSGEISGDVDTLEQYACIIYEEPAECPKLRLDILPEKPSITTTVSVERTPNSQILHISPQKPKLEPAYWSRVVGFTASTSTGTQEITDSTIACFRPKLAMFFMNRATDFTSAAAHSCLSIGWTDGTDQYVMFRASEDNDSGGADTQHGQYDSYCVWIENGAGGVDGRASMTNMIDGGVEITWNDGASSAFKAFCILIGGADCDAECGYFTMPSSVGGTTAVTGPGFTPELLFFGTTVDTWNATVTGSSKLCFGTCSDYLALSVSGFGISSEGTDTQPTEQCLRICGSNATALTDVATSGSRSTLIVDSLDANGFTAELGVSTTALASKNVAYLAVTFNNKIAIRDTLDWTRETAESTDVYFLWPDIEPDFLFAFGSKATSPNTTYTDEQAGSMTFGAATSSTNQFAIAISDEDGVNTSNTASRADNDAFGLCLEDTGSIRYPADFQSFVWKGFHAIMENHPGTPNQQWYFLMLQTLTPAAEGAILPKERLDLLPEKPTLSSDILRTPNTLALQVLPEKPAPSYDHYRTTPKLALYITPEKPVPDYDYYRTTPKLVLETTPEKPVATYDHYRTTPKLLLQVTPEKPAPTYDHYRTTPKLVLLLTPEKPLLTETAGVVRNTPKLTLEIKTQTALREPAVWATVVPFDGSTSLGNQTIQDTNIEWYPEAAVLFFSLADDYSGFDAGLSRGVSFVTEAEQNYHNSCSEDGDTGGGDGIAGQGDSYSLYIRTHTGANEAYANWVDWQPGGMRINWGDACSSAWKMFAVFLGGHALRAKCSYFQCPASVDSTTDVTGVGFEPDLVLLHSLCDSVWNSAVTGHSKLLFGACANDGAYSQGSITQAEYDSQPTSVVSLASSYALAEAHPTLGRSQLELGDFDSNGFSATLRNTTSEMANKRVGYLAFNFGGRSRASVGFITTRTATGSQKYEIDPAIEPTLILLGLTRCNKVDFKETDHDGGVLGMGAASSTSTEYSFAVTDEDNVSTSNTANRAEDFIAVCPDDDQTASLAAQLTTLWFDGYTLDYGAADSTSRKWLSIAIENPDSTLQGGRPPGVVLELLPEKPTATYDHLRTTPKLRLDILPERASGSTAGDVTRISPKLNLVVLTEKPVGSYDHLRTTPKLLLQVAPEKPVGTYDHLRTTPKLLLEIVSEKPVGTYDHLQTTPKLRLDILPEKPVGTTGQTAFTKKLLLRIVTEKPVGTYNHVRTTPKLLLRVLPGSPSTTTGQVASAPKLLLNVTTEKPAGTTDHLRTTPKLLLNVTTEKPRFLTDVTANTPKLLLRVVIEKPVGSYDHLRVTRKLRLDILPEGPNRFIDITIEPQTVLLRILPERSVVFSDQFANMKKLLLRITIPGETGIIGTWTTVGFPYYHFLYETEQWAPETLFFLDTMMKSDGGDRVWARLRSLTTGVEAPGSLISTTSTTYDRVRSPAVTLTDANEYYVQYGAFPGETGGAYAARVLTNEL